MKTAIVYVTRSGSTEQAALRLAELMGGAELINISKKKAASKCDISGYDTVIIGTPIRMGQLEQNVVSFVSNNRELLEGKKLGFFILNFFTEHTEEYLETLFPTSLRAEKASFGALLDINRLHGMDKMMMKMVIKQNGELPPAEINDEAIQIFAKAMMDN